MKKFIITIDTEGDNLWAWRPGDAISTENSCFLQRFQNLADKYGFKPVWLSNYEMLSDDRYVKFARNVVEHNSGEIGMHLHAWSTPPEHSIPIAMSGQPYLIEYPSEIMEAKIDSMTRIIEDRIGVTPISHRAGRWALNDKYLDILVKKGYQIDCSVTPHCDWSSKPGQTVNSKGSDYSEFQEEPFNWRGILEVPVSIRVSHTFFTPTKPSLKRIGGAVYRTIKGQPIWLRPNGHNLKEMKWLLQYVENSDSNYIMFMLHSSEMMPGGSPTFRTSESIEKMYLDIEEVFRFASRSFEGSTLLEYALNQR